MSEIRIPLALRGVPLEVRLSRDGVNITAQAQASISTRLGPVRIGISVSIEEAPIRALLERATASELAKLAGDFFSDPAFVAEVSKIWDALPDDAADVAAREVLRQFVERAGGVLAEAEAAGFRMGDAGFPGYANANRYTKEIESGDAPFRYGLGRL